MSSGSTGIRKRRTPEDRITEAIDGVADAYLRKARKYSDRALSQGGALGNGPVYGSNNPGTNSLPTSGGAMIGSIAFNPALVRVEDGRINIEPDQDGLSKASSYMLVTGQGSPDDLLFIDGADKNGQYLILQGTESQILVLKAATILSIDSISGVGTVTVVTSADHNMLTGAKANILDTDNFNISNVTVTVIDSITFTYSALGSIFPETKGIVQNGNILTPDGNDVTLNATVAPNGIPVATLIFDPSVEGFGAWRLVSVSEVSGTAGDFLRTSGGVMFGPIAYDPDFVFVDSDGRVPITSSYLQSTAPVAPNNEVFFFDGALFNGQQLVYQVTNQTIQVIKNGVFKNISNIVGNDTDNIITVTIDDTSLLVTGDTVNINSTTTFDIDDAIITITGSTTFTYDLGSIGSSTPGTSGTVQRGNIVMPDDQDLTLDSNISTLGVAIATFVFDPTIGGGSWRLTSSTVSSGGGGLTEPIILTPNVITQQTAPTVSVIDWSKNPNILTMTADTVFDFSNLPPSGKYEGVLVIIDVNEIGDFATPIWPLSLTNPPVVSTVAGTRTSVMLYTIDGGTVVTHATSVGSSSGGEFFGPWTGNHNAGLQDLLNLNNIDFDGGSSTIQGLFNLDFFQASQSINSLGEGLSYQVDTNQDHNFLGGGSTIAKFENNSGVLQLNMSSHIINNAKSILFAGIETFPGNTYGIGIDGTNSNLEYNVPTGESHDFNINDVSQVRIDSSGIIVDPTNLPTGRVSTPILQLNVPTSNPLVVGQFTQDGTDVFIFSGAIARNLSDIGVQSSIEDGNVVLSVEEVTTSQPKLLLSNGANLQYTLQVNSSNIGFIDYRGFTAAPLEQWNVFWDDSQVTLSVNKIIQFERFFSGNSAGTSGTQYAQYGFLTAGFADGVENGKIIFDVTSKGTSNAVGTNNSYSIIGGAGLINTNTLHSFRGSMILESDQTEEEAILRLTRNDTTMTVDDVALGTIQFRGEDSAGNDTEYGSISVEAADVSDTSENGRFAVDLINGTGIDRMIVADSLTNEIKFAPTSNFDYIFDTTGFFLTNVDASPSMNDILPPINFIVNDSGAKTTYAKIRAELENVTDAGRLISTVRANGGDIDFMKTVGRSGTSKADIEFLTGTILKASSGGVISYFINDEPDNLDSGGSLGTLQMPVSGNNNNPPSINDLDVLFGDFIGAHGMYGLGTARSLYIKTELVGGEWARFQVTSYITS